MNVNGQRRVVITGMGMVSPLGNDVPTSWSRLLAGESGAAEISAFDHTDYNVHFACELKDFDPTVWIDRKASRRMDRFAQMILAAARQAEADSGVDVAGEPDRFGGSVRRVAETVLEVGRDGKVGRVGHELRVGQRLVARHAAVAVALAEHERKPRTGRRERLEAETREDARRARVPRVRNDERAGPRVQRSEPLALFDHADLHAGILPQFVRVGHPTETFISPWMSRRIWLHD